jgi:rRNA processing protein Krr1/Pno1
MVKTILIDVINEKAMKLLQDLEHLDLIRLHKSNEKSSSGNWVKKLKGSMTKQPESNIEEQFTHLRSEW